MKVKILNEEIDIQFCMAVELAYERISGKPFDTTALATAEGRLALGMAAIIAAKPDTEITIERLLREAKGSDIKALNDAVAITLREWLDIPEVIAEQEATKAEEGEQPKN